MSEDQCEVNVLYLEKINEVVDLCIDHELYQYLENDQILKLSRESKDFLKQLRNEHGKVSLDDLELREIPVVEVILPEDLRKYRLIEYKGSYPLNQGCDSPSCLFKKWSYLFWAKIIRAEILKNNTSEWNKRYDELILFMENSMPRGRGATTAVDKTTDRTLLTFLMELSALDIGEASYGYAERARRLLEKVYPDRFEKERQSYDRWIWWNMAIASQHMGRNQKAVLDFNRVIRKFREEVTRSEDLIDNDNIIEFLLNIGPARMQRASIQLKLQLGYHALQTLSDEYFVECLEKLKDEGAKLIQEAAEHLIIKKELLKVEAFLQLGEMKQAESSINTLCRKIFPELGSDWKEARLPDPKDVPEAIEIQLVEQIVSWYLENAKALKNGSINLNLNVSTSSNGDDEIIKINQETQKLILRLDSVENIYWDWIYGKRFDERVYFSRWAQFLGICAEIYQQLNKLSENNTSLPPDKVRDISQSKVGLIQSVYQLYEKHRERLPNNTPQGETIKLKELKLDDLSDFVNGLSEFYNKMSKIINEKNEKPNETVDKLREDHFKLLAAVDENEKDFGENRTITSLKRCDERLIWLGKGIESNMGCKSCLNGDTIIDSFSKLLSCKTLIQKGYKDNPLYKDWLDYSDYESIMAVTEHHLLEHLQTHSFHKPNSSLHFVGLQRWNSLTPAQGRSVGGGYLIYQTNGRGEIELGIAIDPGYDYVRNLFKMGFSLKDIDIVLISHAHPDHIWDFESMVHLVHELDGKTKVTHRFNVILTLGSYRRLEHIITKPELRKYINPLVIDIDKEIEDEFLKKAKFKFCKDKGEGHPNSRDLQWRCLLPPANESANEASVEIACTKAYHDDKSERSDSFGFIIKFNGVYNPIGESKALWFGYTGDTKWVSDDLYNEGCPIHEKYRNSYCSKRPWESVAPQYKDCDVLLMHLGSLIDHKNEEKNHFSYYKTANECESLIREKTHPYLMGIIRFLKSLHKVSGESGQKLKLILMGEFGEELRGGIRKDLVRRLEGIVNNNRRIIPVDVGLDIIISDNNKKPNKIENDRDFMFLCALCDNYCSMKYITYFSFGQDEAIFHVCKTCRKAVPEDVRKNKLKELYEVGKELKSFPSSD